MNRRPIIDSNASHWASMGLLLWGLFACISAYLVISFMLQSQMILMDLPWKRVMKLILWEKMVVVVAEESLIWSFGGSVVKWGLDHKFDTEEEWCKSCKLYVVVKMGLVCVIVGFFAVIIGLVVHNSVRLAWSYFVVIRIGLMGSVGFYVSWFGYLLKWGILFLSNWLNLRIVWSVLWGKVLKLLNYKWEM